MSMGIRLPAKAGEIVDGDVAGLGSCRQELLRLRGSACARVRVRWQHCSSNPKGPISLSEIKDCPALRGAEFDPRELVECYCLISASLAHGAVFGFHYGH